MTDQDTAYLLINLGTPNSPRVKDVRKYLAEFLMDPRVIDINKVGRFALVHGLILPTRPKTSAAAYAKIWTERGSPLKFHTEDLAAALAEKLPHVFWAMRYGQPAIGGILKQMTRFQRIRVLPLYPQHAWSSTDSSVEKVKEVARDLGLSDRLEFLPAFYHFRPYQQALAASIRRGLEDFAADHVLLSYHGLPERQLAKALPGYREGDEAPCLKRSACCDEKHAIHAYCYRHQCFETTKAVARELAWPESFYSQSFQSRLGRTPWIQPFTDLKIREMAESRRIRKLAVVCPSFVADCLETLEEIGMRAKEQFESLSPGAELRLIPCLNEDTLWVDALKQYLTREKNG